MLIKFIRGKFNVSNAKGTVHATEPLGFKICWNKRGLHPFYLNKLMGSG